MHCTDAAWWQKLVSTHVSSSSVSLCYRLHSKSPNDNEGFGWFSQAGRTESVDSTQLCLEATHKTLEKLGLFVFDSFVPSQICIISI